MNKTKSSVADHFDALLDMVKSGTTFKQACLDLDVNPVNAYAWVNRSPDRKRKLEIAFKASPATRRTVKLGARAYDEALRLIQALDEPISRGWRVEGLPTLASMRVRGSRDVAFRNKLESALQVNRQRFPLTGSAKRFSPVEKNAAIDLIAGLKGRPVAEVDRALRNAGLPAFVTLAEQSREASDGKFLAAWGHYHARTVRLRQKEKARRDSATYVLGQELRKLLSQNEIYGEARNLFHRGHPHYDDMVSEVVAAVYEGRLSRDEMKAKGPAIGRNFSNRIAGTVSLDVSYLDSDTTVLDTLSADDWSFEDAI